MSDKSKFYVSNSKCTTEHLDFFSVSSSLFIPSIDINGILINVFLSVSLFQRFCLQLVSVPLQVTFLWGRGGPSMHLPNIHKVPFIANDFQKVFDSCVSCSGKWIVLPMGQK